MATDRVIVRDVVRQKISGGGSGPAGRPGISGVDFGFKFSVETADEDPGSGTLRLNNAAMSSATLIFIDDEDDNAVDIQPWLRTFDDAAGSIKGLLKLQKKADSSEFALFQVTGLTENAGYFAVQVVHIVSNGSFAATDALWLAFAPIGQGEIGVVHPASWSESIGTEVKKLSDGPITGVQLQGDGANAVPVAIGDRNSQNIDLPAGSPATEFRNTEMGSLYAVAAQAAQQLNVTANVRTQALQQAAHIIFKPGSDVPTFNSGTSTTIALTKGGTMTVTRGSSAVYQDENGVYREIDAHALALVGSGYIFEPQRTNLITESDNFSAWNISGSPVRTSGQGDPDGGTSAYLIEDDDAGNAEGVRAPSLTLSPSTWYAYSVRVKAGTASTFALRVRDNDVATNFVDAVYNVSGGVFTLASEPSVSAGYEAVAHDPESLGGGWYRLTVLFRTHSSNTTYWVYIFPAGTTASGTGSTYAFRAQVEQGTFATSPIQTTGSTVARSAGYTYEPSRVTADPYLVSLPASTNKCVYAVNRSDTTGWTRNGDASATLSVVNDADELRSAGLHHLAYNGLVFKLDNSGGAANAYADNSGQVGNTNKHSASVFARGSANAGIGLNAGEGFQSADVSAGYQRITSENITPGGTNRALRVTAPAGQVVYFTLGQLEQQNAATPPIPNSTGSSLARSAQDASIPFSDGFDLTSGITMQFALDPVSGTLIDGQEWFVLADAVTTEPSLTFYALSGQVRARYEDPSGSVTNISPLAVTAGQTNILTAALDPNQANEFRAWVGNSEQSAAGVTLPSNGAKFGGQKVAIRSAWARVHGFVVAPGVFHTAILQTLYS